MNHRSMRHIWAAGVSALALTASGQAVMAQSAPGSAPPQRAASPSSANPAAATPATDASTSQVPEIIVTAQKRSERLSDVGMTISAFSADTLRQAGVQSAADLQQLVPGLTYAHSNTSLPVYTLRGVGFYETSLAAYPAVTVYADQAPLSFPLMTSHTGLDLDRVEVLKGPQGILFGQNSTGGAIDFVAAKPTADLHYGADLSYGEFNRAKAEGFISGPITDTLRARLSASVEHGDDWQESYTRNDSLGKIETYVGRLLLDWAPNDRLNFELNVNGWVDKSDPQAAQFFKLDPQVPAALSPAMRAYPTAPDNDRAADWGSGADRPRGDQNLVQVALKGNWDFGPATLTSVSAYVHATRNDRLDPDGMALQGYELLADGYIDDFYQELRIANSAKDRLRYTVGANLDYSHVFDDESLNYSASTLATAYGFAHNGMFSDQKIKSGAVFGNVDYDLLSRLTVKLGARYTVTDRSDRSCTTNTPDGAIGDFFQGLSSLVRGTPTPPIPVGGCTSLGTDFLPELFTGSLDEDNVSWRAGLDYKLAPHALLYVNIAKGYKAGSFPTVAASSNVQLLPVTQESVLDYEGGFKVELLERKLSLDGAVFYYDYSNKQLRSKYIDPIFGVLDKLDNIPESSIRGAELSAQFTPFSGLRTNAAVTYLDGTIDKFSGVNGAGVFADFDGTPMPFAPKWSVTAGADYDWPLTSNLTGSFGGGLSYNSSTFSVVGADPDSRISDFTLLDLRAGVASTSGRWRVKAYVKNLTNDYYWTNAIVVYDQKVRYAGQPRTFGVSLSLRY